MYVLLRYFIVISYRYTYVYEKKGNGELTSDRNWCLAPAGFRRWGSSVAEAEAGLLACRSRRGRRRLAASVSPAPTAEESATRPEALLPSSSAPPLLKKTNT